MAVQTFTATESFTSTNTATTVTIPLQPNTGLLDQDVAVAYVNLANGTNAAINQVAVVCEPVVGGISVPIIQSAPVTIAASGASPTPGSVVIPLGQGLPSQPQLQITFAVAPTNGTLSALVTLQGGSAPWTNVGTSRTLPDHEATILLTATETFASTNTQTSYTLDLTPNLDPSSGPWAGIAAVVLISNQSNQPINGDLYLEFIDSTTGQVQSYTTDAGPGAGQTQRQVLALTQGTGDAARIAFSFGAAPTSGSMTIVVYLQESPPAETLAGVDTNGSALLLPLAATTGAPFSLQGSPGLVTGAVLFGIDPFNAPGAYPLGTIHGANVVATPYSGIASVAVTTSQLVKNGPGCLGTLSNPATTTSPTITVYDNTTNSGKVLWNGTLAAGQVLPVGMPASTGLYVALAASGTITVSYA